jgi:hypothetical protein
MAIFARFIYDVSAVIQVTIRNELDLSVTYSLSPIISVLHFDSIYSFQAVEYQIQVNSDMVQFC